MKTFDKIVVASNNYNKYVEYMSLVDRNVVSFLRFGPNVISGFDVKESASSYVINAMLKAQAWAEATGMVALGDDSGIEVEALNWGPGLYSHRLPTEAGMNCNDWLLAELKKLGNNVNRRARFITSIALVIPAEKRAFSFTGECWGTISTERHGRADFAYDPIFIPDGYDKTYGEMGYELKNQVSHRGRAIQNMIDFLELIEEGA